ncbi:hydrogenase expression protein HupH [Candidatus Bathyarchaeota archaeon]|nr:hydrogenase expression protein HupH [Candidatus Bathyarchaeota archaeon]RJS88962.1 MAG: hydrogenase expression protein HupH [Candidatus Bathyarchaeota archaeon]RLI33857.1 MAG: hydrogenase expression protein HupH [Candidatus Bathyarchaeota archaeon]
MKICVVVPIISKEFIKKEDVRKRVGNYVRPDTEVDFVFIDYGPASIESRYDDVMAAPFVVKKAEWAEKNGYDAVVVSCMMDPGVKAAKEALDIPVVGPGEAARAIASILGEKVARIYPRGITVLELRKDPERTYKVLLENAKKALSEGAQVLILGCTGLTGYAKRLQEELGVPVLEGEGLALALAQLFVDVGLSQSKLAYRKPPKKKRVLPGFEEE